MKIRGNKDENIFKNHTLAIRGIAIVLLIFHHNFRSKSVYEGFTCSFFPFSEDKVVFVL